MRSESVEFPIYAVPLLDRYLLVAPFHETTALVNRSALHQIADFLADGSPECCYADISSLGSILKRPVHPMDTGTRQPVNPVFLGIIPSRRCTMQCVYCDFGGSADAAVRMEPTISTLLVFSGFYSVAFDLRIRLIAIV